MATPIGFINPQVPRIDSVDRVSLDGHVETRAKAVLQCICIGDAGTGWFY